jgi:hypothetical protein
MVFGDPLAHLEEVECAPARRFIQLRELVVRHVLRIRDIRREAFLGVEDSDELVPNVVRRLLDRIEPGKIAAIEELDRREAGKMIDLRARIESFLSSDHDVERITKPVQGFAGEGLVIRVEVPVEEARAIVVVFCSVRQRVRDRGSQVRVQPLERRRDRRRRPVGASRLVGLPLSLEQLAAQEQSRQIPGIERQRALNRAFFAGLVAQVLAGEGKTDPLLGVRAIGLDKALECRAGRLHVSLSERALAKRRQCSGMRRINLKNSTPEAVSLLIPARARGAHCLRFKSVDFQEARVGIAHRVFIPDGRDGLEDYGRGGGVKWRGPSLGRRAERAPLAAVLFKAQDSP